MYDPEEGLRVLGLNAWPHEEKLMQQARGGTAADSTNYSVRLRQSTPLTILRRHSKPIEVSLRKLGVPRLLDAEIIAGRLYTGPTFEKYNSILRKFTKAPFLVDKCNRLCAGNSYTTTIHAINSALIKLRKVASASKVYRGLAGGALPSEFLEPDEFCLCSAVDFGFMSTSCVHARLICPLRSHHLSHLLTC